MWSAKAYHGATPNSRQPHEVLSHGVFKARDQKKEKKEKKEKKKKNEKKEKKKNEKEKKEKKKEKKETKEKKKEKNEEENEEENEENEKKKKKKKKKRRRRLDLYPALHSETQGGLQTPFPSPSHKRHPLRTFCKAVDARSKPSCTLKNNEISQGGSFHALKLYVANP
ncbi:UNVERIFIED_CONTAM: hypothetical protein K2H54_039661 [Gekko kuhli]